MIQVQTQFIRGFHEIRMSAAIVLERLDPPQDAVRIPVAGDVP